MKKLILLLITISSLTHVIYASFPVSEEEIITSLNTEDPAEEIWAIVSGVFQILLMLYAIYYCIKTYKNTYNPRIKYLKLSVIIAFSLILLFGIMVEIGVIDTI
jgi:hypothetical protein